MSETRKPIRKRVRSIVFRVSVIALTLASAVGLYSMFSIRDTSSDALRHQLEVNLTNTIADKAALADAQFGKFAEYLNNFAMFIHDLYMHPQNYVNREVLPPDAANQGVLTMQRYLRDNSVQIEDVQRELMLMGNLEPLWNAAMAQNENIITTIYIGTESGLHIAYDPSSELGVEEGSAESHFDYTGSDWYVKARELGKTGFTDIYQDSYGRGMMISCFSPFYDENDKFEGAVSMDILITDIYQQIVSIDLGAEGNIFLMDGSGFTVDPEDSRKLTLFTDLISDARVKTAIKNGRNGFTLSQTGVYYVYAPVNTTGWMLCISIPEGLVLESVYQMDQGIQTTIIIFAAAFLVLIIAVILVSYRFSKSLTNPLVALEQDALTISGGNLDYRAEVRSNDEIGDLATSFNQMAASLKKYVTDLTKITAEKERISAELNVATQIQADMLPRIFPAFPERNEFDLYAIMDPAKEVGGDFYDYFMVDHDHIALVMADVSGKGVPAALFMVIAKTLIKSRAQMGDSPAEILKNVNEQLCEGNEAELFVTVWLAIIEISTGHGLAANAGHEHPVIRRAGGKYELVQYRHSPAVATMEGIRFKEHSFELYPGDSLFVYTDGVPEATNADNQLFGTQRMLDALNHDPLASPRQLLQALWREIDIFVGDAPQFDDITMLNFQYSGASREPAVSELTLEATVENLKPVLTFLDSFLEQHDCPLKTQMQLDVAVEEIYVNIAHYAYAPGTGEATIRIESDQEPGVISISFIDSGMPYNPLAKPDPDVTLSAEDRKIGGLGIFMVKKMMDDMRYENKDGKNILTFKKRIE